MNRGVIARCPRCGHFTTGWHPRYGERHHGLPWTADRIGADEASTVLDPTGANQRPRHRA